MKTFTLIVGATIVALLSMLNFGWELGIAAMAALTLLWVFVGEKPKHRPVIPADKTYMELAHEAKWILMVSYDCGNSYYPERVVEDPYSLQDRLEELDSQFLRWALVDKNENRHPDIACRMHRALFSSVMSPA